MNSPRIQSILTAETIGLTPNGIDEFKLNKIENKETKEIIIPSNIRLGQRVERVVSALIKGSENFAVVYENRQIISNKTTIGELDFILEEKNTHQIIHVEIVYKFYIYDPDIDGNDLERWIGPNRKDSFLEKFRKLKNKQFPLLYNSKTTSFLEGIQIDKVQQKLCFMANLYWPYKLEKKEKNWNEINSKAIVGWWLQYCNFTAVSFSDCLFCLPTKHEWGIKPETNSNWSSFETVDKEIKIQINRQFSLLCWVKKENGNYEQIFIVWW